MNIAIDTTPSVKSTWTILEVNNEHISLHAK